MGPTWLIVGGAVAIMVAFALSALAELGDRTDDEDLR